MQKNLSFFIICNNRKFKSWRRKHNSRYKKSFYTKIDIRKLRQEKETKTIKDRILRDIKNSFEHEKQEENYYKLVRESNFWSSSYTKVMVIKIKHYQLKNILIKLVHI